ncbi:MAG: hypothetical protein ACM3S0_07800 [Acidobacteriota bacterium]
MGVIGTPAIATPAFAQSFCTCDGTGNVLKFTNNPITYQNQAPAIPAIGQSGLHAFAMVPAPGAAFGGPVPALFILKVRHRNSTEKILVPSGMNRIVAESF